MVVVSLERGWLGLSAANPQPAILGQGKEKKRERRKGKKRTRIRGKQRQ